MSETAFVYPHISIVAILAAAVAQFILGGLWYSPLTPVGKRWLAEMHVQPGDRKPGIEMLAFPVSALMAAWAVAMVITWSGAGTLSQGILAALVVGFAAIAQAMGATVANGHSMALGLIHVGYLVIGYTIMGALVVLLG
ncbi:MAG: DUF1761 domain-containing protein [Dehalococcoidia bacterium]